MTLATKSTAFYLESGQALISPVDSRGSALISLESRTPRILDLRDGEIRDLEIPAPGYFRLLLLNLKAQRCHDHTSVLVPVLNYPYPFHVGREDLERNQRTVTLELGGLFRITLVNPQMQPLPGREVRLGPNSFGLDSGEYLFCSTTKTDEAGSFMCLGNPWLLDIILDPDTGLLILPV